MTIQQTYEVYLKNPQNFSKSTVTNIKGIKAAVEGYDKILEEIKKLDLGPTAFKIMMSHIKSDLFPRKDHI